jgi:unsaturated rhamnogalacturonyl hydrolase
MSRPIVSEAFSSFLWLSGSLLGLMGIVCPASAGPLPERAEISKQLESVNAYFMKLWPDPGKEIGPRPSNIWTRGVYYEGLIALYQVDPKPEYLDYAVRWGESHKWGLRHGISTRNADDQCCGQTYLDLYLSDKKPERIQDITASVDAMVKSPDNSAWTWIDALQMAMPVFTRLMVLKHDTAYSAKMYDLYHHAKAIEGGTGLYNAKDHLWWRDKSFLPPYKEPNGAQCYWSRGNGWVLAALTRTLMLLPQTDPHRAEYLQDFIDLANAVRQTQRDDGFWNVSLHDPGHFGGKETTGTALFVYGMAWGLGNGILPKETFLPAIAKGWAALSKEAIHPNGFVGYVQGTGKEPKDNQPVTYDKVPDFEDFGVGCVLLAGTEVFKLTDTPKRLPPLR